MNRSLWFFWDPLDVEKLLSSEWPGLESVSAGDLLIGGRKWMMSTPEIVISQWFSKITHSTPQWVDDNIAFSLTIAKEAKAKIREKITGLQACWTSYLIWKDFRRNFLEGKDKELRWGVLWSERRCVSFRWAALKRCQITCSYADGNSPTSWKIKVNTIYVTHDQLKLHHGW